MFSFNLDKNNFYKVHFIGIGGVSMSGISEILLSMDYDVSGSDCNRSETLDKLQALGAKIYIGHAANNINSNLDLVVYTDAISDDNPEYLKAIDLNIPVVNRATLLGLLMKDFESSIAISGTHGKTTTTSMVSTIINNSEFDPTILLGGQLDSIGGNVRIGGRKCLLTEACEYKANILKYFPSIAVILNIDSDHLDYFKSIDHVLDTFVEYTNNLSENDVLIIADDCYGFEKIKANTKSRILTYGKKQDSDYVISKIEHKNDTTLNYTLFCNGKEHSVDLNIIGDHNVTNSVAALIVAHELNIPMDTAIKKLKEYQGVHRRLEVKGSINGATIIDDYAHHPTEISASLLALRELCKKKLYCVFQPHTYTRTRLLLDQFSLSFENSDLVIITDIYAAREKNIGLVHSKELCDAIISSGENAIYFPSFDEISDYLIEHIEDGDIVVTMGAGNIHELGEKMLEKYSSGVKK